MMPKDENQLTEMLTASAKMGATLFAIEHGLVKSKINKAEACRRYTRRLVDRWIKEGRISPVKISGTTLFDVKQLEIVSNISQLFNKHLKPHENI